MNNHEKKKCKDIWNLIHSDKLSGTFYEFVDRSIIQKYKDAFGDYLDLKKIKDKIDQSVYERQIDFANDMRKLFDNCKTINPPPSAISYIADYLLKKFEKRYKEEFLEFSFDKITEMMLKFYLLLSKKPDAISCTEQSISITNLEAPFEEIALKMLAEKLQNCLSPKNIPEVLEILELQNDSHVEQVDIVDLSQNQVKKLWNFVDKYTK